MMQEVSAQSSENGDVVQNDAAAVAAAAFAALKIKQQADAALNKNPDFDTVKHTTESAEVAKLNGYTWLGPILERMNPAVFTTAGLIGIMTAGYLPPLDPNHLALTILPLYSVNDTIGLQMINPTLGSYRAVADNFAKKLGISEFDALKLLYKSGDTITTEFHSIDSQLADEQNKMPLTLQRITEVLGVTDEEGLMMLAVKTPAQTYANVALQNAVNFDVLRTVTSAGMGMAIDSFAMELAVQTLSDLTKMQPEHIAATITLSLLAVAWGTKEIAKFAGQALQARLLHDFQQQLKAAYVTTNTPPMSHNSHAISSTEAPLQRRISSLGQPSEANDIENTGNDMRAPLLANQVPERPRPTAVTLLSNYQ